jgi:site-specific recombinase XerD
MTEPDYLAPFIRAFFEDHLVCRRNVSRNTIQSYRDALKLLLAFAAEQCKKPACRLQVSDLSEEVVVAFLTHLETTRANAIQTRNHRLVAIRRLFDYIAAREPWLLEQCHQIATIPRKRGAVRPEIGYLEKDQLTALLGAVAQDCARGRRDYTLLLFLYNTGARVQEIADMRVSWLTLVKPYKVELLGKGRKWRTCPLWESTAEQLRQLIGQRQGRADQDDYLFVNRYGRPLSRSGIADMIRRYASKAATTLPSLQGRRVTPHTFRHTTAMHLLQSGVEVNVIRSWLGHVSIATTNRYIEIDLAMKAKALAACEATAPDSGAATRDRSPDILAWLESL